MENATITIITSAGIGAIVSTVITLISNYIAVKYKREEKLLDIAHKLAVDRREFVYKIAEQNKSDASFYDDALLIAEYYSNLKYLIKHNKLQKYVYKKIDKQSKQT